MRSVNALILSSDRVSKEWSSSALKVLKGRECFIEVYINDWYLIIIIYYLLKLCLLFSQNTPAFGLQQIIGKEFFSRINQVYYLQVFFRTHKH